MLPVLLLGWVLLLQGVEDADVEVVDVDMDMDMGVVVMVVEMEAVLSNFARGEEVARQEDQTTQGASWIISSKCSQDSTNLWC
jgi:hypothetical protein